MPSRSPSPPRGRNRSRTRSQTPPSAHSRSRSPRPRYDSRSMSRSRSPPPRRNGRYASDSRSRSRGRYRDSRDRSFSPRPKATKVVVERLSKNMNEDHLWEIFGAFGPIKDLDLPINRTFNTNRGTAYILFDHEADAEDAIAHMHEAQVDGATINVSIVLPRRKMSPPPPVARHGANIDPRVPFSGARGGGAFGPPGGGAFGPPGGGGRSRRRPSPPGRFGPRSDVYRPSSRSHSQSPLGPDSARGGAGGGGSRYRSRSRGRSHLSRSPSRSRSPAPRKRGGHGRSDDHDGRRRGRSISLDNQGR